MTAVEISDGVKEPYPGLRPFRPRESLIFFGRDDQVDALAARLGQSRFLAVVGSSGCGKSSLVRAGLIPRLNSSLTIAPGKSWRVARARPGTDPSKNLAKCLLRDEVLRDAWADAPDPAAALAAAMGRGPRGLAESLAGLDGWANENLLILVDQFEEVFRFRREGGRDESDAYVAMLLAAAESSRAPIYVILTMRSDYLGDCDLFPGLPERLNDGQFLTPRLNLAQSREAIEGPAGVFDADLEPELVERVLHDMCTVPDPLPMMQHALMRLWRASGARSGSLLTLDAYREIGGVAGALNKHAKEVYDRLDGPQQRICQVMFRRLCDLSAEHRDSRRPTALAEIAEVAEVPAEKVAEVAEQFRGGEISVLMPAPPVELAPDVVLDITHEALIRQWELLKGWVKKEAESAEQYLRLDSTAALWQDRKAALLGNPDLEYALRWRSTGDPPNAAWARRYGGDFERAMRFLDESHEDVKRKEAETLETAARLATYEQELAYAAERREAEQRLLEETRGRQAAEAERALYATRAAARMQRLFRRALIAGVAATVLAIVAVVMTVLARRNLADARKQTTIADLAKRDASARAQEAIEQANKARQAEARARHQARISTAQRLAFQWQSAFRTDPRLGLLLATEAVKATSAGEPVVASAEQVLREGLVETGGSALLDFSGDSRPLTTFVVSPDLTRAITCFGIGGGTLDISKIARSAAGPGRATAERRIGGRNPIFSADGQHLAVLANGVLLVTDFDKPKPVAELKGVPVDSIMALSGDGRYVAATQQTGKSITVWALDLSGKAPLEFKREATIRAIVFSPDGKALFGGDATGVVTRWRLDRRDDPGVDHHMSDGSAIVSLAVSPDGKRLAAWAESGGISVKFANDPSEDPPTHQLPVDDGAIRGPAFSAEGRRGEGREAAGDSAVVRGLLFSPDGRRLVAAMKNGSIRLWSLSTSSPIPVDLRGHAGELLSVGAVDNRSRETQAQFVTCGADGVARLWAWDAPAASPTVLHAGEFMIRAVTFSGTGDDLAAGATDGGTRLWRSDRFEADPVAPVPPSELPITALAFSPKRKLLAVGDARGVVRGLSLAGARANPRQLLARSSGIAALAFSHDGRFLIAGEEISDPILIDVEGGVAPPAPLKGYGAYSSVVGFCPDDSGRFLIAGQSDGSVKLGNFNRLRAAPVLLQPRDPPAQVKNRRRQIVAASFDSSGRSVVTVSESGSVLKWQISEGDASTVGEPRILLERQDFITSVASISNDHSRVAVVWPDSTPAGDSIFLRDSTDRQSSPVELRPRAGKITCLSFSPDGRWLAGGTNRGDVLVWPMRLGDLIAQASRVAGRNLTRNEWSQYFPDEAYHKTFPDLPAAPEVP